MAIIIAFGLALALASQRQTTDKLVVELNTTKNLLSESQAQAAQLLKDNLILTSKNKELSNELRLLINDLTHIREEIAGAKKIYIKGIQKVALEYYDLGDLSCSLFGPRSESSRIQVVNGLEELGQKQGAELP